MNIYDTCPVLENEKFIIRLFQNEDCDDLLKVYSDKKALPFFKAFITAVEKTNAGYQWDWDEKKLIGKNVKLNLQNDKGRSRYNLP